MLDAAKYAQHFPDEDRHREPLAANPISAAIAMRPSLLAALSELEKEFREILRAQQPERTDHSE